MVAALHLDDEELTSRAVQGIGSFSDLAITIKAKPKGMSSASSIEGVDEAPTIPSHRPALERPHYMYNVLRAHAKTEESTTRASKLFDEQIKKDMAEMERLSAEKEEALKHEAEAAASRDTWETLSNISQYIAGAGAIALGTALGGVPGYLLVAGGVAGIGSRVIHDTNLLQAAVAWYTKSGELQKKLTNRIEMGLFFLQMGLGLAGGYSAWTAGAFAASNASILGVTDKLSGAISAASSAFSISSNIGKAIYDKRVLDYKAKTTELNAELSAQNQQIAQDTGQISRQLQEGEQLVEQLHKAVRNSQITLD